MKSQTYSFLSHDRQGNPIQVVSNNLCTVYIPLNGLGIDERKLFEVEKERENLEKAIIGAEKFLNNKAFLEKAPPEVVEGKRAFVEDAKKTLAMMEKCKDGIDMDDAVKQNTVFLWMCETDPLKASLKEWLERENCFLMFDGGIAQHG